MMIRWIKFNLIFLNFLVCGGLLPIDHPRTMYANARYSHMYFYIDPNVKYREELSIEFDFKKSDYYA